MYPENDIIYGIDLKRFEYSSLGNGDLRKSACALCSDETLCDFKYADYFLSEKASYRADFAQSHSADNCLCILLRDSQTNTELRLYYQVFENSNVITSALGGTVLTLDKDNNVNIEIEEF